MGRVIKAESHTVEFSFLQEAEYSDDALEFYDQPPSIQLEYRSKTGRLQRPWHTPDYFVLRQGGAGWEECKPAPDLQRLARAQPNRYSLDEKGVWRCPPGERYAAAFGLTYRVRSSKQINWIAQSNWQYLEDYYRRLDQLSVVGAVRDHVVRLVDDEPGIALAALRERASGVSVDDLNVLVASGEIYVDLNTYRLTEPQRAPVYRSKRLAQAYASRDGATLPDPIDAPHTVYLEQGAHIVWDGVPWQVLNIGAREVTLLSEDRAPVTLGRAAFDTLLREGKFVGAGGPSRGVTEEGRALLAYADEAALAEAARRFHLIAGEGEEGDQATTPARTVRSWRKRWREAEISYGSGLIGLLPRYGRSGRQQLATEVIALLDETLATYFDTTTHRVKRGAYGEFLLRCAELEYTPPSERTFYLYAKRHLPAHAQALARSGPRGAYRYKEFHIDTSRTTTRHGDRAWELAHIDHTEVDLELVSSLNAKRLGKAWLTLMIDGATRRILAHALSFDRPSVTSCMLVIRECVRRHGRLPQTVVVDGGSEFRSAYFEALLARYEVTKRQRPPHEPRFGAVLERLFGATNTEFIYHLLGNTQLTHQKRQVTKSTDPKTHAVWTLAALSARLDVWAYEVYDTFEHLALGESPREAYARSLERDGARTSAFIPYDHDFVLSTYATTPRGVATVQPGRGVQIHYLVYWCDAMRDPAVEGKAVPVRYDPFDITIAYAFVRGEWRRCRTAYGSDFAGCSERELTLLTQELRRQRRRARGRQVTEITQRQLAEFRRTNRQVEDVLRQQLHDRELRAISHRVSTAGVDGRFDSATGAVGRDDTISAVLPTSRGPMEDPAGHEEVAMQYESTNLSENPVESESDDAHDAPSAPRATATAPVASPDRPPRDEPPEDEKDEDEQPLIALDRYLP
jgi:transposase InsO family protein